MDKITYQKMIAKTVRQDDCQKLAKSGALVISSGTKRLTAN